MNTNDYGTIGSADSPIPDLALECQSINIFIGKVWTLISTTQGDMEK